MIERITQKIAFTTTWLKKLKANPPKHRTYYADLKGPRGFQVLHYPSGVVSFLIYRWVGGTARRMFIGRFDDLNLQQARRRAAEWNHLITLDRDPVQERRQRRMQGTLRQLYEDYAANYSQTNKRASSIREDAKMFNLDLAKWGARKVGSITHQDVQALHTQISKRTIFGANRAVMLLSGMYNYLITERAWNGVNPARGIRKNNEREHDRDRFITPSEMPRFLKALRDDQDETFQHYVLLAMTTGARSSNLLSMAWAQVDGEGVWRIPASRHKSKRTQALPLPSLALRILERRRELHAHSEWVFPSPSAKSGHVTRSAFVDQWAALLKRAGMDDKDRTTRLRVHDLRRTAASWAMRGGASAATVKDLMAHHDLSMTSIYARSMREDIKAALESNTTTMGLDGWPKMLTAKPQ